MYNEIRATIGRFGFVALSRERTLFVHPKRKLYLAVHVDDLVVVAPDLDGVDFAKVTGNGLRATRLWANLQESRAQHEEYRL